jgi:HAD superfamily hydrolase (TIGR01509 family)
MTSQTSPTLIPPLITFAPELVIFDKDGTLIDFHAMWGTWATDLVASLEIEANRPLSEAAFQTLGFDPATGRIDPQGPLALEPAHLLRVTLANILIASGLSVEAAQAALERMWQPPDPVALARPLTDLPRLFNLLRQYGARIAIATSDDRALTEATVAGLGLAALVDGLACADDGLSPKPAPDMILHLCRTLQVAPARTVMIGDNTVDLQMGRAAGVGLVIGLLSGLGARAELEPLADMILPSIDDLVV